MNFMQNFSLKPFNTFGIDVVCDYFVEVFSVDELRSAIHHPDWKELPLLILGGGSNILFTRHFHGLVIKNSIKGISIEKETDKHAFVKAYSGEVWHDMVLYALEKNLGGIENLSLIPGQVGAAPMQNIGAYGVELEAVFDSLEAVDMLTGEIKIFSKADCQ